MAPYISLLLLVFAHHNWVSTTPIEGAKCRFPQFIFNKPRWEKDIQDERRKTGKFIQFSADTMTITDLNSTVPSDTQYEIAQCTGNTKFLLKEKKSSSCFCVDIVKRSNNVFQWKKSEMRNTLDLNLCEDSNLVSDEWPFVWPFSDGESYEKSPIEGGYTMKIQDNEVGTSLCGDYWTSPVLESECVYGEGIQINFRHFDCVGSLGMNMLQDLHSVGSWIHASYQYVVVANDDDLWPKLWMLRIPKDTVNTNEFKVDVFPEIISTDMEDSNTFKYFTWILTKKSLEESCEDESPELCVRSGATDDPCDGIQKVHCKKTCGECDKNENTVVNCDFFENIQGSWQTRLTDNDNSYNLVTFGKSSMKLPGKLPSFSCMNITEKIWVQRANRKPLRASFQNGCQARFLCLEAAKKAPDVLHYTLSRVTKSDEQVDVNKLCFDENFGIHAKEKNPVLKNNFESTTSKILIKETGKSTESRYVKCADHDELIHLHPLNTPNLRSVLNVGGRNIGPNAILNATCTVNASNPEHHLNLLSSWKCLAHFQTNYNKFLIVEAENKNLKDNIQCWISHRTDWSSVVNFYVVKPSVCHKDIAVNILIKKYTKHLAEYTIEKNPKENTCELNFPKFLPVENKANNEVMIESTTDISKRRVTPNINRDFLASGGSSERAPYAGTLWGILVVYLFLGTIKLNV